MARSRWLFADESEQSYLVSISDLMAGLLFVFMITVTVFALLLVRTEEKRVKEVERLRSTEETRDELLRKLEARLKKAGVEVSIDLDNGVLRLPEEVLFESGSARFVRGGEQKLATLGRILMEVLPDYVPAGESEPGPVLEAVMIEGHTDAEPMLPGSPFKSNWDLSTARAINTYNVLVGDVKDDRPDLTAFKNRSEEPLLGVAGYAETRPFTKGSTPEEMEKNRRIDLRFLMAPPQVDPASSAPQIREDIRQRSEP